MAWAMVPTKKRLLSVFLEQKQKILSYKEDLRGKITLKGPVKLLLAQGVAGNQHPLKQDAGNM